MLGKSYLETFFSRKRLLHPSKMTTVFQSVPKEMLPKKELKEGEVVTASLECDHIVESPLGTKEPSGKNSHFERDFATPVATSCAVSIEFYLHFLLERIAKNISGISSTDDLIALSVPQEFAQELIGICQKFLSDLCDSRQTNLHDLSNIF